MILMLSRDLIDMALILEGDLSSLCVNGFCICHPGVLH